MRPTPLKRARFWLSLLLPLLALVWIAERALSRDSRVYSSGRMSEAHAVLEKECSACHLQQAGAFSAKAADSACLDCHDGPAHHAAQTSTPACASCHSEHRGRISVTAAPNQACAECHSDLKAIRSSAQYASHIRSFEDGNPEFAALRSAASGAAKDPGTIKSNHAIHMKPIRGRPNGPYVQLECGNCHRITAADADLTYTDPKYSAATVSYTDPDEFLHLHSDTFMAPRSVSVRELMAPVKFANACAACHLLTFDKRFDFGVPHDKPEVVHTFLIRTYREYISAHPTDVRVLRDPSRDLTGKPLPSAVRVLTAAHWVTEHTAETENLLWRQTCKQCHTLTAFAKTSGGKFEQPAAQESYVNKLYSSATEFPYVAPPHTTLPYMPPANIDHSKHERITCVTCHANALMRP